MIEVLPKNLINLAGKFDKPLYLVGGAVRNYLIDNSLSIDLDLSAPIPIDQFISVVENSGFKVSATYKRTGTVLFVDEKYHYEYTAFRREKYVGGRHTPEHIEFTEDILEDALRRDFKCNAVYYDIKSQKFIDVLGGIEDIKNKTLDTVREPDKVFSSDGLRLMRLARFIGELDFKPTEKVLEAVEKYSHNILDISPERIYAELNMILSSDKKYHFSDPIGHYNGLKILSKTRVLDNIIPELTAGRNMEQRKDFHKYDVLEHSLRTVLYSEPRVRLGALLHDVGKPFCLLRDGCYHKHGDEGVAIAEKVLKRLKADNEAIEKVKFLVKAHMLDLDLCMRESKIRKFIVINYPNIEDLLSLKQADYMASMDSQDISPTIIKWRKIIENMKSEGVPFSYKELAITAVDLMEIGYKGKAIGKTLEELFDYCVLNPEQNQKQILVNKAKKAFNKV
ncbi:MAG: HD domain-containing protein [Clostridia bacterium]|nr:HD domain-containing protein [Clostridia bacterium]